MQNQYLSHDCPWGLLSCFVVGLKGRVACAFLSMFVYTLYIVMCSPSCVCVSCMLLCSCAEIAFRCNVSIFVCVVLECVFVHLYLWICMCVSVVPCVYLWLWRYIMVCTGLRCGVRRLSKENFKLPSRPLRCLIDVPWKMVPCLTV